MRSVFLYLLVFWAVGASAAAQVQTATTGRVVGYVYTANNSVVVDAQVQLRATVGGGVAAVTRTNATGEFTFDRITPGAYVIELVNPTGSVTALGHPFTVAAGETVATFVRIGDMLPTPMIPSRWELAAGVIGSWRRGSGGAPGLGVMFGYNSGGPALVAEMSGVRRDGHNDWRALGGLRCAIVEGARGALLAHAMVGSMIRSGKSGLALAAGLGAEVRGPGRAAFRLQAEVTRDTADERRATGVRASAWVVVR